VAKKKLDPQAKAKRQKIIAAVGGVLLLGVLAFQVPRTLKLLHQSNATATSQPATTTVTSPTSPVAAPPVGGSTTSSTGAPAGTSDEGVTDPSALTTVGSGQLLAFSRFRTKDPFAQQIDTNCSATSQGSSNQPACPASGGSGGTGTTPQTGATGSNGQPPAPAAKPTSAQISVNGVTETVAVRASFPASNPTFMLVSLTRSAAKISIAGGSLSGGAKTVTLKKGSTLTLMNTADGTRYALRLVAVA